MTRILIRGGCILSMDPKIGNHRVADLLIEDGVITEVGPDLHVRDAEVVDAAESIVMPGFVDTHRHVSDSLFRGAGDLATATGLGVHYSADDVYAATLVGLLGAVEAGITTVVDWADIDHASFNAAIQGHSDSGLRTIFVPAGRSWAGVDDDRGPALKELTAREHDPLRSFAVGLLRSVGGSDNFGEERAVASGSGLRLHAHAGIEASDRRAVAALAARSLLGADVTLVHCSGLDDSDLDAIAASGAMVSLAPSSEMVRGLGPPPIQQLIDRRIRPGLGTDSERLAPGDMFAPMRAAISLQHATHFDRKLAGKGGLPNLLTTREVIRFATIDGARAVGLEGVTGSLTPGKQADIVVLRADGPNIVPLNDPIGAVVWGMDTSNLDWVFVRGVPLMREGVLAADLPRATAIATQARDRVATAAGLLSGVGP